jgi:hypothetical protein
MKKQTNKTIETKRNETKHSYYSPLQLALSNKLSS